MSGIRVEQSRRKLAKGNIDASGRTGCYCRFEEDVFEQVRVIAAASNISFAEQVRRFVRDGLAARTLSRAA